MTDSVGLIASLHRYPVKSMMGEALSAAQITERGMFGDRSYALCDTETGKVVSANLDEVKAMPGVKQVFVVEGTKELLGLHSGVAVVAESWWQAKRALAALPVKWNMGEKDTTLGSFIWRKSSSACSWER